MDEVPVGAQLVDGRRHVLEVHPGGMDDAQPLQMILEGKRFAGGAVEEALSRGVVLVPRTPLSLRTLLRVLLLPVSIGSGGAEAKRVLARRRMTTRQQAGTCVFSGLVCSCTLIV